MKNKPKGPSGYWERIYDKAAELGSDGCSFASGGFRDCCVEHDVHYRLGTTIDGYPITRREADARFRSCMQCRSRFGWWSPVAWWRWAAVRTFGRMKKGVEI